MAKKDHKKSPSSRKLSKKKIVLVVVLALLLVAGLWYAWVAYQSHKRFVRADQVKTEIINKMVERLGDNVISTRVQNECFHTEQGPYDNGVLWCQAASIVRLKGNVEIREVGKEFVDIVNKMGLTPNVNESDPVYWVVLSGRLACVLSYQDSAGDFSGSATLRPFRKNDPPAIAVTCSDRAAARHYPYVDPEQALRRFR